MFRNHLPPEQAKHLVGSIARAKVLRSGVKSYLSLFGVSELHGLRNADD